LYDIFARSKVAPTLNPSPGGTSNETPPGEISLANDKNPHFLPDAAATCRSNPGFLGDALLADLKAAFVKGTVTAPNCAIVKPVGGVHANAVGYATIDVVGNCNPTSPLTTRYFGELLYDNVLTGDYQHINPNPATGNYAGANPLVHIRAVPEGGPAGIFVPTPLPYTFYDLYTTGLLWRTMDRRQPLPSAFLPRLIQGGTSAFNTNLEIWREARAAPTLCPLDYTSNAVVPIAEIVRFDEHENATYPVCIEPCPSPGFPALPSVSNGASFFPSPSTSGDVGGWLFLNLNNFGSPAYSAARNYRFGTTLNGPRQSQAWVVTNMFAEGRYAVEMDAAAVGNGCSPAPGFSPYTAIGPAPNPNP
ncbi:MAG TPA: hypothetical protein VG323_14225, partial [Thermoanaerobaculia bacterium]|nr:hypothetical protein [Thermoanaerobaculia bacterium]